MKKKNKERAPYGMAIPAGLFIGIGIGFLTGQVVAYTLIGLGVGFLAGLLISGKNN